jgi:hypothetical protein
MYDGEIGNCNRLSHPRARNDLIAGGAGQGPFGRSQTSQLFAIAALAIDEATAAEGFSEQLGADRWPIVSRGHRQT